LHGKFVAQRFPPRRRRDSRAAAMPEGLVVYRFGACEFDPESRSLFRADTRVRLSLPQQAILAHLLSHPVPWSRPMR